MGERMMRALFAGRPPTRTCPLTGKDPEKLTESKHKVTIGGQEIRYTARAGVIQLKDAEDKATASIFHIAYTRDDATNAAARPLTFSFNGGPGSSSVWLHMGAFGPNCPSIRCGGCDSAVR